MTGELAHEHESQRDIDVAICGQDVVSHKPVLQKVVWN